jgi:hypothetical protein
MHGSQKLAPRTVDTGHLSHVDFDFFTQAGRREPHIFRFGNPRTAKLASELQATLAALFMNCDTQHRFPLDEAHASHQMFPAPNRLSYIALKKTSKPGSVLNHWHTARKLADRTW